MTANHSWQVKIVLTCAIIISLLLCYTGSPTDKMHTYSVITFIQYIHTHIQVDTRYTDNV